MTKRDSPIGVSAIATGRDDTWYEAPPNRLGYQYSRSLPGGRLDRRLEE